jgi:large subunit ribosomal protein L4
VHVLVVDQLNAYDVLVNDEVVFTSAALQAFVNRGESSMRTEPVEGRDDAPSTGSGRRLRQAQDASEEAQDASEDAQEESEEPQGVSEEDEK